LEEQKKLSQFFIDRAKDDSKIVASTLDRTSNQLQEVSRTFVAKHLDDNKQLWDVVYDQKAEIAAIKDELARINENLLTVQSTLKDIFTVLKMKERQNG
jgi:septal ring factor EnvC (AmiA/AmiB activator)